jgi:methylase of polypeptide subunit release factors
MRGVTDDDLDRLREALGRNDFRYDAVAALLGDVAHSALGRADLLPALRATTGGTPLETLVRLFLLGTTEPEALCAKAFDRLPLDRAGWLLEPHDGGLRATLDVRPYAADDAQWWVVSDVGTDVRPGPLRPDHVLGVGGASTTLAQATIRTPVAAALDVGTGCGVQALHLSRHSANVTATDRNPRALALARMTATLNGLSWDLVEGDLLAPVDGRAFDLVVANPPFVVGPGRAEYAYRDSGLAGDAVSERLVREVPRVLTERGTAQLLANWLHVRGDDWRDRVGGWLPEGCDALVLQREVQDPAEYVALWQRDAADASRERAGEWLDWFAAHDVEGVGFGIVTLRNGGSRQRVEDARQPVAQPLGPDLARWLDLTLPVDLLDATPRVAADVTLEQTATATNEGWDVAAQAVQRHTGLCDRAELDAVGVALLGGCDGSRTLRDLVAVLASAYGVDADALGAGAVAAIGDLAERGFVTFD